MRVRSISPPLCPIPRERDSNPHLLALDWLVKVQHRSSSFSLLGFGPFTTAVCLLCAGCPGGGGSAPRRRACRSGVGGGMACGGIGGSASGLRSGGGRGSLLELLLLLDSSIALAARLRQSRESAGEREKRGGVAFLVATTLARVAAKRGRRGAELYRGKCRSCASALARSGALTRRDQTDSPSLPEPDTAHRTA